MSVVAKQSLLAEVRRAMRLRRYSRGTEEAACVIRVSWGRATPADSAAQMQRGAFIQGRHRCCFYCSPWFTRRLERTKSVFGKEFDPYKD
ncbi:MAG: hypothetical protein DMD54_17255 [Gemmatimonadetes bacterium]|nr:MAG: hypothetical protein DMD54_17255 [Gemmatimonadota bacterium]